MASLLGRFVWASVLFVNAVAILNEERFLSRIGWGKAYEGYEQQGTLKKRLINFISSVRTVLRIPLIAINLTIIVYEIFLG